jgi:hypothetical protein
MSGILFKNAAAPSRTRSGSSRHLRQDRHARIAIGAGTDVAMESADVVLMKSDPFDVVRAITLSRATLSKMHQNLWWAVAYNVAAFPLAAGCSIRQPSVGRSRRSPCPAARRWCR